jgi:RNA methyltransferase, TrmH family
VAGVRRCGRWRPVPPARSSVAPVEPITSTQNPRVRQLAGLTRARTRRELGLHLVEGPNAVREALRAGIVTEVFVTPDAPVVAVPEGVAVTSVSDAVLAKLADATTPQGIVAVARIPAAGLDEVVGAGLLVVLDAVADPGNAGTILRTADAAGAVGVVLTTGSVDAYAPKSVRAAVGSTYHLPVVSGVSLAEVSAACRRAGQRILGLDGAATLEVRSLETSDAPIALVLGNEAHGLAASARDLLDGLVAVPIHGRAESLNVAAAAAIAIYSAARGLREQPPPP